MQSKLDHALASAKRGFRVFPLVPNGKTPAIKDFPNKASTDEQTIRNWWARWPNANIGIATGRGLVVIDIDNKNGKDGDASFAHLDMMHDIPPTYTVATPSGGRHVYLATDDDVRNSASKIGEGLDIRGSGGFVVGPGSTVGTGGYDALSQSQVGKVPATLLTNFVRSADSDNHDREDRRPARIELDTPQAQQRATQYLVTAEPAVEGAGGDQHTYSVAAKVKDFGVSQDIALDLMLMFWNDRCSPPWQPDDLADKIRNAYEYGTKPIGIADPAMDFEPVAETTTQSRLYAEYFGQITHDVETDPLIEDYLDKQAFSVIYGESHTGKTFVALDMAYHIAAGKEWNGRQTEQGGVVYVAAEGGRGIRKRIAALKKHFGAKDVPLALVPCAINLLGRNSDVKPLVELIDAAALQMSMPVALVVIDTLSRAMAGANENASEDMTAFVGAVDKIRAGSGAHVMVVHHAGKDTAKGARGHSSLRAATDTELEVANNALSVRKQRDGEHAETIAFALKTIELGENRRGRVETSCVVRWAVAGEEFNGAAVTKDEQNFMMAVKSAQEAAGEGGEAGVSMEAVMDAYRGLGFTLTDRTVRRGLVSLESKGAVRRCGSARWVKWAIA